MKEWKITAWIAGIFCVAVIATLLWHAAHATANDPWKSPRLIALQEKLIASPKDENLKAEIRALDLEFRQRFFQRRALNRAGGVMLLLGGILFIVATRRAMKEQEPQPASTRYNERENFHTRLAVGLSGIVICIIFAIVAFLQNQSAPQLPTHEEFLANWPRFRGPDGGGAALHASALSAWDETKIIWKTEIPAAGFNSPVVWGNRIFLSGASTDKREVFCFNATNGKLLWQRAIENPSKGPEIDDMTGYAASTMTVDGQRVYAIFPNGDLAALTFKGELVWSKNLGVLPNHYGYANSLAYWRGRLIVQFDGSDDRAASRLLALDGATGNEVWAQSRKVDGSWATPVVVETTEKTQIVTVANPSFIIYNFDDGAELWRADVLSGDVAPSPIFAADLLYIISPSNKIVAVRSDGSEAWKYDSNIPDVTTPVSNGECIFFATSNGDVTCLDAKTGEKQWEHDFKTEIQSSPGIAGNHLYIIATDGHAWILEAGRTYKEIGTGKLDDKFFASPVFMHSRIYLRGNKHLYCLGEKE